MVTPMLARSLPLITVAEIGVVWRSVCRRSAVTTTSASTSEPETFVDDTDCAAVVPLQLNRTADALKHKAWIFMTLPFVADALCGRVPRILTLTSKPVNIHSNVSE